MSFNSEKGGERPARHAIYPTHFFNRYALLEQEEEQQNSFLVGYSMIRHQVVEFRGSVPRRRRWYCYPGGVVDDIAAALDKVSLRPIMIIFSFLSGTKDVCKTRSKGIDG